MPGAETCRWDSALSHKPNKNTAEILFLKSKIKAPAEVERRQYLPNFGGWEADGWVIINFVVLSQQWEKPRNNPKQDAESSKGTGIGSSWCHLWKWCRTVGTAKNGGPFKSCGNVRSQADSVILSKWILRSPADCLQIPAGHSLAEKSWASSLPLCALVPASEKWSTNTFYEWRFVKYLYYAWHIVNS